MTLAAPAKTEATKYLGIFIKKVKEKQSEQKDIRQKWKLWLWLGRWVSRQRERLVKKKHARAEFTVQSPWSLKSSITWRCVWRWLQLLL